MKTSKVLLLSLGMALCVGGGVGAAVAITRQQAGNTGSGDFDKAISLCWGSKSSTVDLADMTTLSVGVAQYRYLAVTPESSKSVAGNVTLSFTLAPAAATNDIAGITVSVYKTASLATDADVESLISGVTAEPVLTKAASTGSTSFAVAAGEATHETNAYYAIKVVYDGSQQETGKTVGGSLTIAQSFAA